MTLARLLERADVPALDVTGITADSRAVRPGMVFAALAGARADGAAFIADAVARGAVAVLAGPNVAWPEGVARRALVHDAEPRAALARAAVRFAGAMPETVIAVTGTNGKTSTVNFVTQIFRANGIAAASIGTLGVDALDFPAGASLTTPDPLALADTLAALHRAGINHVAIEASSHGLAQHRLDGLSPVTGAFTNLTRDHLDFHRTMNDYRAAKLRLFTHVLPQGARAIVNADADTESVTAIEAAARARKLRLITVGVAGRDVRILDASPAGHGTALDVVAFGRRLSLVIPLIGQFQAENALLAAAIAHADVPDAFAHLSRLRGARGRLEHVAEVNGASVYVDYAHTPDALARALAALRPHTSGRLAIVFGAGGDRDPGKRAPMGAATAAADRVYVTDDNPRSEPPAAIRAAIRAGCPAAADIADRAAAIARAIGDLCPGDLLVVAGKGHETGQTIGADTFPFDDAAVIRGLAA